MSPLPSNEPPVAVYRPEPPDQPVAVPETARIPEFGGRKDGSEPTRYGDWEKEGRCIDF
jgi:hypothetical protein